MGICATLLMTGCTAEVEPELPDNDLSALPESGAYTFSMDGSGTLTGSQCPATTGTPVTSGPAQVTVSDDDLSLTMTLDGQTITLSRPTLDDMLSSDVFPFPVEDNGETYIGDVSYTIDYWTQDYAQGTLLWNNGLGCAGNYPFTLE